jgi:hypothetical protein
VGEGEGFGVGAGVGDGVGVDVGHGVGDRVVGGAVVGGGVGEGVFPLKKSPIFSPTSLIPSKISKRRRLLCTGNVADDSDGASCSDGAGPVWSELTGDASNLRRASTPPGNDQLAGHT